MEDLIETLFDKPKAILFLGIFLAVCIFVIMAIMFDLWDGVHTARKTGVRIHSHKLRVTIAKISEYFRFIAIAFLIDCIGFVFAFWFMPFVVILFGVGLICVEAKSMFEHARRRKSSTNELPNILKKIVAASNTQEAKETLERIISILETKKEDGNNNNQLTPNPQ